MRRRRESAAIVARCADAVELHLLATPEPTLCVAPGRIPAPDRQGPSEEGVIVRCTGESKQALRLHAPISFEDLVSTVHTRIYQVSALQNAVSDRGPDVTTEALIFEEEEGNCHTQGGGGMGGMLKAAI